MSNRYPAGTAVVYPIRADDHVMGRRDVRRPDSGLGHVT